MSDRDTEKTIDPSSDEAFEATIRNAEAGVADALAVYEEAEARYFAAVSEITTPEANAAYTTHT